MRNNSKSNLIRTLLTTGIILRGIGMAVSGVIKGCDNPKYEMRYYLNEKKF